MSEHDLNIIPEEENIKYEREMCSSCIHKSYCIVAYKKDHWCGNHKKNINMWEV